MVSPGFKMKKKKKKGGDFGKFCLRLMSSHHQFSPCSHRQLFMQMQLRCSHNTSFLPPLINISHIAEQLVGGRGAQKTWDLNG